MHETEEGFNSLFEMPKAYLRATKSYLRKSFNSLFEMPSLSGVAAAAKLLGVSFNSLFEMPRHGVDFPTAKAQLFQFSI